MLIVVNTVQVYIFSQNVRSDCVHGKLRIHGVVEETGESKVIDIFILNTAF